MATLTDARTATAIAFTSGSASMFISTEPDFSLGGVLSPQVYSEYIETLLRNETPLITQANLDVSVHTAIEQYQLVETDNALDTRITNVTQNLLPLKADLDPVNKKIPSSQLPSIALGTSVPVANQAAMLALTSGQVQPGDLAVRADGAGTWMLMANDPSVLANWTLLNSPADAVSSVAGHIGAVILAPVDITGLDPYTDSHITTAINNSISNGSLVSPSGVDSHITTAVANGTVLDAAHANSLYDKLGQNLIIDRGNWVGPGTQYNVWDLVTANGLRWLCKINHLSGATFSGNTNWVSLSLALPPRVVARARRTTPASLASGTTLASSSAVVSLPNIPVTAGRLYRVYTSSLLVYSNGNTSTMVAQTAIAYTTDGSTPSAGSAVMKQDNLQLTASGSPSNLTISVSYAPAVTGLLGLSLSYFMPVTGGGTSVGMSGSAIAPIELVVEDVGADPGATGNVSY